MPIHDSPTDRPGGGGNGLVPRPQPKPQSKSASIGFGGTAMAASTVRATAARTIAKKFRRPASRSRRRIANCATQKLSAPYRQAKPSEDGHCRSCRSDARHVAFCAAIVDVEFRINT